MSEILYSVSHYTLLQSQNIYLTLEKCFRRTLKNGRVRWYYYLFCSRVYVFLNIGEEYFYLVPTRISCLLVLCCVQGYDFNALAADVTLYCLQPFRGICVYLM